MSSIAVVILNWNGKELLEKFLPGVIKNTSTPDTEVIVADNASSDDSIKFLESSFPDIRLIKLDKNYGFAGGYNKALEQIDSEYFILLNSDVEVSKHWIEPLKREMDNQENLAACMPLIRSYHKQQHFEYAGASGGYIDKYGFPFCRGRVFDTIEKDAGQYNDIKDVFWATGACMMIRSEIFLNSGGFDSDFFAHMEEIDLCWRIKNQGYTIKVIPDSKVYHVGGGTLPNESAGKLYLNFRNSLFMLYKNLPAKNRRVIILIRKLLDGVAALKFLFSLKLSYFNSVLKAHYQYYKSLKKLKNKRKVLESKRIVDDHNEILKSSIVKQYFIKGKKLFSQISF